MPVIVPAAVAGGQALLGLGQTISANRKRKKAMADYANSPYQIPESQIRATNIASKIAQGTDLPAQDLMEERLASGTAQAVSQARKSATSPSQVLQSTVNSYLSQQAQQQTLDMQAANSYQQRQGAYQNALVQLAPFEDAKYRANVLFPIQAQLNEASGQGASGMSNIGSGISGALSMYANQNYLNSLNKPQAGTSMVKTPSQQLQQMAPPNDWNAYWNGGNPGNMIP
jgi:hypothetical protein